MTSLEKEGGIVPRDLKGQTRLAARHLMALLALGADQLDLNAPGAGELAEQRAQVKALQGVRFCAVKLVVGMNLRMLLFRRIGKGVFVIMQGQMVDITGCHTEQWAVDRLALRLAFGHGGKAEQDAGLFEQLAHGLDSGFLGRVFGEMLEAQQVDCRTVYLQLKLLALQRHIQLSDAVLMGMQAGVSIGIVIIVMRQGISEGRNQGERQDNKQQATHGNSGDAQGSLSYNNIRCALASTAEAGSLVLMVFDKCV
jgi:hypothetical protein